ncbi:hypothetical protein [Bradyrhizobium sp. Bra64]|uniref:hypothetical protein n=1 Tax=Bradyrhizobium sp. Bra64 TaxID=2926009 RepID=UPI002118DF7A|nr:hypothetical protein [Bradyrhizobium sp. Bra64]
MILYQAEGIAVRPGLFLATANPVIRTRGANAINASFDPALPYDFAKGIAPVAAIARIQPHGNADAFGAC